MYWVRRSAILLVVLLCLSFIAWSVPRILDPTSKDAEKRAKDQRWVASSPYFLDRQLCRWISLCGIHHIRKDPASHGYDWEDDLDDDEYDDDLSGELRRVRAWDEDVVAPSGKRDVLQRRRVLKEVPDYVYRYAPLVHLYSGEEFWPSDIREHLEHMTVYRDSTVHNSTEWSLHNLGQLNKLNGMVTMHSNDDVESRPPWLHSHNNIPQPFEDDPDAGGSPPARRPYKEDLSNREHSTWYDTNKEHPVHRLSDPRKYGSSFDRSRRNRYLTKNPLEERGHKPDSDGYSRAPAVLVLVDKGEGVVDAFWFFFYSYNLGQTVFGMRFGNHVGDWEHFMIRFQDGKPRGVFLSEHEAGQSYVWDALEKSSTGRPIIYSAVGSHAMYPQAGDHPYVLPFKLLKDVTDKGPLWDPGLNNYAYHYDYTLEKEVEESSSTRRRPSLVAAANNPQAPTSWFHYTGRWGDEVYALSDLRQWRLFGQYHYTTGPTGPKFKSLDRKQLCKKDKCLVGYELDPKRSWRD
uniref:Vacuolar protein sorting-associated protein 62 n=1 Tax=Bionectria ochroleuca TaxID=29856 RepID=A0A8H7TSL2_BIOOC